MSFHWVVAFCDKAGRLIIEELHKLKWPKQHSHGADRDPNSTHSFLAEEGMKRVMMLEWLIRHKEFAEGSVPPTR